MVNNEYMEANLPFWSELTLKQKNTLKEASRKKQYHTGDIMHAGKSDCTGLFLIETGQIRAYIISESGKEITLYRLLEQDLCIFSASCMLKNINFDVFIEAEKDTTCYILPTVVFEQVSKENVAVAQFTNELLSSRFSDVMWVVEQVVFQSFDRRLASFILEQSAIEESDAIQITQERIARHLGSAREVVSRMLKYFIEEGVISASRGKITILDRKKLKDLSTSDAK